MANKKITQLPITDVVTKDTIIPIVDNAVTKHTTIDKIGNVLNVKHKIKTDKVIEADDTVVISGDYLIFKTTLTINEFESDYGQLYIGGNLIIADSQVINDGVINVAGGIEFIGDASIIGNGVIV